MPFTFLAHQAAVLPLKIARPAWFCGWALVFGSMAPDFEYFARGEPWSTIGHTLAGQFTLCLPATLLLVLFFRRAVTWRSVPSALLGSGSHVLWDGFTHEHGFVAER